MEKGRKIRRIRAGSGKIPTGSLSSLTGRVNSAAGRGLIHAGRVFTLTGSLDIAAGRLIA